MKIGIIGMTTTGLAAGAALANAGFETLLYCPDDEEAAEFLEAAVRARMSILVCGGTGTGKTNFINVLAICRQSLSGR